MTATFIACTKHKKAFFLKKKILEHSYYVSKSLWIIYIVSHAFYGTKNLFSYVGIATIVWKCGVSSGIPKTLLHWKDRCSKAVAVWNQLSLLSHIICNMTKNIYYNYNKNHATRVYNRIEISFCISTVTSNYMLKKSIWIIFTMKLSFLS